MGRPGILRCEAGTVLVEMAMVLPIFLLIAWCVIDFGRAFYTNNSLATAVREGARVAAVLPYGVDSAASVTEIKAKVAQAFNSFGGTAIAPDSIKVTRPDEGTVRVQVKGYVWKTSTPINVISGGQIVMTKTATFRWEFDT